jgi:hypothetical protein
MRTSMHRIHRRRTRLPKAMGPVNPTSTITLAKSDDQ